MLAILIYVTMNPYRLNVYGRDTCSYHGHLVDHQFNLSGTRNLPATLPHWFLLLSAETPSHECVTSSVALVIAPNLQSTYDQTDPLN